MYCRAALAEFCCHMLLASFYRAAGHHSLSACAHQANSGMACSQLSAGGAWIGCQASAAGDSPLSMEGEATDVGDAHGLGIVASAVVEDAAAAAGRAGDVCAAGGSGAAPAPATAGRFNTGTAMFSFSRNAFAAMHPSLANVPLANFCAMSTHHAMVDTSSKSKKIAPMWISCLPPCVILQRRCLRFPLGAFHLHPTFTDWPSCAIHSSWCSFF